MEDIMKKLIILVSLILALALTLNAEQVIIGNYPNDINLLSSNMGQAQVEFTLGSFNRQAVTIDDQTWYLPRVKQAGVTLEAGYPEVPIFATSLIIPPQSNMELEIINSEYVELDMPIAPSKGNLTRNIDPSTVAYTFADFYQSTGAYPQEITELTDPFILRDFRGITIHFKPFVYYPATGITRIYTKITVQVSENGVNLTNALSTPRDSYAPEFADIYQNMFLNFAQAKYPSLDEEGRILVIKHSMFDTHYEPWVQWKRQKGYEISVVDVAEAGPTANEIKSYIQGQYNLNDGLMFVQIFGDAAQVPTLVNGGGGSDPSYALLAGSDSYPDIYVGRFSATTVAELQTQITRSVHYERDIQNGADWLENAIGIASNEGGGSQGDMGESDQVHMDNIRDDLLNYGYTTVDQLYQNFGATAAQVASSVNSGRGLINYVGHGSTTSWVATGFNNTNVNNLVNEYELPFIVSVACVNGNFVSYTCFAEAWLRAENNGNPTGAVAMYASSVNQGWNPPMRAQDEITDLLVSEAKYTIGGLFYNGASKMIEIYGTDGIDEYKNWHIFGDASLMVRTKNPDELFVDLNPVLLIGMSSLTVTTEPGAWLTLSAGDEIYGKAVADDAGLAQINLDILPDQPMELTLTVTAFNKVTHISTVDVLPADGAYIIVTDVQVTDDNNGNPEFNEVVTVHVAMENVGNDPAEGVSIAIISDDPYISVLDDSELIADIPSNSTGSTLSGIDIQISDFVPDQYAADFSVNITLDNGEEFIYDYTMTINAPKIEWGTLVVDDPDGNDNGRIDPGESFILSIPFTNNGNAGTPDIETALIINGGESIITPVLDSFSPLQVGGEGTAMYFVTLSSQIHPGSTLQIIAMANYGNYTENQIYNIRVGILVDGFENGFTDFPWSFSGGIWTIDTDSYSGSFAVRSAAISHNQSTSLIVTLSNPSDGIISFWKKLSTELNHDYLKFYINEQLKNQWSGIDDAWSQVSYMVQAGTNTYRWEFSKDFSVSDGLDGVWIDEVVFPADEIQTGSPELLVDPLSLDFGNVEIGSEASLPLTISNIGNASMIGYLQVPQPYTLQLEAEEYVNIRSYILGAGESLEWNIGYRPTEEGVFPVNLIISSDDPNAPTTNIPIMGSATPVSNQDEVNPVITELRGNYPNPFNPTTTISFSLNQKGPVSIDIYNILGQKVNTLFNGELGQGLHKLTWNGTDDNGRAVASGMYFYKMKSNDYSKTKKMILMK